MQQEVRPQEVGGPQEKATMDSSLMLSLSTTCQQNLF